MPSPDIPILKRFLRALPSTPAGRIAWVLAALLALAFLWYASWLGVIRGAQTDLRAGRYPEALEGFRSAGSRMPGILGNWVGFRAPTTELLLKEAQVLYLAHRFSEAMESLQRAAGEYPFLESEAQFHQWYGNVLFQHTLQQEDSKALLEGFRATLREYQKALELDGSSWDARYNYELIKRLLAAESQDGEQKLDFLMEQLREKSQRGKQDGLPPEKRG